MGEQTESDDFLAFSSNKNSGDSQNQRNNFQYRPYNRNRNQNQRNHNFRREQWGGQRNDSDGQFAPADYSSPVGGYQHRFDRGFRGRPNMNQFQNQRHFTPFKVSLEKIFMEFYKLNKLDGVVMMFVIYWAFFVLFALFFEVFASFLTGRIWLSEFVFFFSFLSSFLNSWVKSQFDALEVMTNWQIDREGGKRRKKREREQERKKKIKKEKQSRRSITNLFPFFFHSRNLVANEVAVEVVTISKMLQFSSISIRVCSKIHGHNATNSTAPLHLTL